MALKSNSLGKSPEKKNLRAEKASVRTTVIVHYDCGYSNSLYIRGKGCKSLSWGKGTQLYNVKPDEWIWETDEPFDALYFKVLINDHIYEIGEDHQLICGNTFQYTPSF